MTSKWSVLVDAALSTVGAQLTARRIPNRQVWLPLSSCGKRMNGCGAVVNLYQRHAARIEPFCFLLEQPDVTHAIRILTFSTVEFNAPIEIIKYRVELRQCSNVLLSRSEGAIR